MIALGDAAAFVVARLDKLHFNQHPKTLAEFETAATQADRLVRGGLVDLQDAADDLWYVANTSGLIHRHGENKMQERMDEALDQVNHEVRALETAALDNASL